MASWLRRSSWWLAALALLMASGLIQGRISHRWSPPTELADAVARLNLLPHEVGGWVAEDAPVDRAELRRAGITAGVSKRYRDSRTGAVVTVLLVCGRPGPVSVHTPDVCYQGAGYELAASPIEPVPGFRAARMTRTDATGSDGLQVYWSWNAHGRWVALANPRLAFGANPYLYKLYLIRSISPTDVNLAAGPAADLARALAAVLDLRQPRG